MIRNKIRILAFVQVGSRCVESTEDGGRGRGAARAIIVRVLCTHDSGPRVELLSYLNGPLGLRILGHVGRALCLKHSSRFKAVAAGRLSCTISTRTCSHSAQTLNPKP